ncbi:hypothetical protein BD779DRAFT_1674180 [Infundibulicybe gibba]|nr:hypothetical protein BD779DRAFT_1674180 [Infundibulicybe gibba]
MAEQKPPDGIQLGPALEFTLPLLRHASLFLLSSAVFLARSIRSFTSNTVTSPHYLLYMPLAIILYIASPAIVFLDISYTLFLSTPARIAVYLFDAFYPLYVFCGVACITGSLLGLAGKLLSSALVELCAYDSPKTEPKQSALREK